MSDVHEARANVIERAVESEGAGAYRRIADYARAKGYTESSELWQWADVLGLVVQLMHDVPERMEKSGEGVAARYTELVANVSKLLSSALTTSRGDMQKGMAEAVEKIRSEGEQILSDLRESQVTERAEWLKSAEQAMSRVKVAADELASRIQQVAAESKTGILYVAKEEAKEADQRLRALGLDVQRNIGAEVARLSEETKKAVNHRSLAIGAAAVAVVAVMAGAAGFFVARANYQSDLLRMNAVLGSPQGKAALRLAELGEATRLLSCNEPSWKKERESDQLGTTWVRCMPGKSNGWVVDEYRK